MGEFERYWRVMLLARRAATVLVVAVVVLSATYSLSFLVLLIDRFVHPFLSGFSYLGIGPVGWVLIGSLAVAVLTAGWAVFGEPSRLDRLLDVRETAGEGDPAPWGKLGDEEATSLNEALGALRDRLDRWHRRGHVIHHPGIFWSPVMTRNACTYGGLTGHARVVFSADLLLPAALVESLGLEEGEREKIGIPGRRDADGILAHELGHVESKDQAASVTIGGLMRFLHYLYLPLLFLDRLADVLGRLLGFLPLLGTPIRLALFLAVRLPLQLLVLLYRCAQMANRLQGQIREYVADSFALKLTGSADEILTALMALGDFRLGVQEVLVNQGRAGESRWDDLRRPSRWDRYATIVMARKRDEPENTLAAVHAFLRDIDDTHPPLPQRLDRLAKQGFLLEMDRNEGKR